MKPHEKTLKEAEQEHKLLVQYVKSNPERIGYVLAMIKSIYEVHIQEALK